MTAEQMYLATLGPRDLVAEMEYLLGLGAQVVVDPTVEWDAILVEPRKVSEFWEETERWEWQIRVGERSNLDHVIWLYTRHAVWAEDQRNWFEYRHLDAVVDRITLTIRAHTEAFLATLDRVLAATADWWIERYDETGEEVLAWT